MNHLRVAFAPYWQSIQHALFPQLERVLGPLTEKQQQLVQTLEVIRIEQMIPGASECRGVRPRTVRRWRGPWCQGGLRHADDARAAGPIGHRRGAAADLRLGAKE